MNKKKTPSAVGMGPQLYGFPEISKNSRTSEAQTLMARLPRLFRTRS